MPLVGLCVHLGMVGAFLESTFVNPILEEVYNTESGMIKVDEPEMIKSELNSKYYKEIQWDSNEKMKFSFYKMENGVKTAVLAYEY